MSGIDYNSFHPYDHYISNELPFLHSSMPAAIPHLFAEIKMYILHFAEAHIRTHKSSLPHISIFYRQKPKKTKKYRIRVYRNRTNNKNLYSYLREAIFKVFYMGLNKFAKSDIYLHNHPTQT